MDIADLIIEPGDHIGVSGSRHRPTMEAVAALRFCIDTLQAKGAAFLDQGCCTGWDEFSVRPAHKAGLDVVGHPPVKTAYLSERALIESDSLWDRKPYHARNRDIAFETAVLLIGPQYPEDDERSEHSGTWMTARFARLYGSRVYSCLNGEITDVTETT